MFVKNARVGSSKDRIRRLGLREAYAEARLSEKANKYNLRVDDRHRREAGLISAEDISDVFFPANITYLYLHSDETDQTQCTDDGNRIYLGKKIDGARPNKFFLNG
jgi:hypothetical protein